MYKCKYFAPEELAPPDVCRGYQDRGRVYDLFDENALRILDMIREWAGVGLTVNNWLWGGSRTMSGFRPRESTVGAARSAHKPDMPTRKACAFDIVSPKITAAQLWALIDKNADNLPCKIRIERTSGGKPITWLHFDTNISAGQKEKVYYFNA